MLYTELLIGKKELKLRLDARSCVALEKKLGKSPLAIFMDSQDGDLPKLEDLISVLHASLQKYNKGYTEEKTYDLYDSFVEDGKTFTEFIPIVMDIFKVSGFFKEEDIAKGQAIEDEKKQLAIVAPQA